MAYPDYEVFGYSFARAELKLDNQIYIAISNVSYDQPTTEEAIMGTKPYPLGRTEGEMALGTGTITFSTEADRVRFIASLGQGFREKTWALSWTLTAEGRQPVKIECTSCRVLGNPIAHGTGAAALGGDVAFSAMNHTINGTSPHRA